MNEPMPVPMASPINPAVTSLSVEALPVGPQQVDGRQYPMARPRTDRLAIASAVCGLTAIIPVISQVIGLGLGIASLVRIRCARRAGAQLLGKGWALTGILTSGFALLGWVAMIGALMLVSSTLWQATNSLDALTQMPP